MVLTVMVLLVLALVLRALYLHMHLAPTGLVRREEKGLLSYEVRRRVCMEALPSHISEYPVPREVRVRVLRFAGVVLWRKEVRIALPAESCSRLGGIPAHENDGRFPDWLQLGPS